MQRLREILAQGGIAILAIVFALAFATFYLAQSIASQIYSVIQQHTIDSGGNSSLTFTVFDTVISTEEILLYSITVAIMALFLFATWWLTRRSARACLECRSIVPAGAAVCRFCTSELPAQTVDA